VSKISSLTTDLLVVENVVYLCQASLEHFIKEVFGLLKKLSPLRSVTWW